MTSLPAQILGLRDRGLVREGFAADLAVLDPQRVRETNSFETPKSYAEGVPYVLVNGVLVIDQGTHTNARPGRALPNVVRLGLGSESAVAAASDLERDEVWVIETNLDDFSPELAPDVMDRLFKEGALDVQFFSTHMKRGRPGFMIQVLARAERRDALAQRLLEETPTIGVRFHRAERIKLRRRHVKVSTRFGKIRAKVSARNGRVLTVKAEIEDLARAASRAGLPLRRVRDEVDRLLAARFGPGNP
jgi:uncharacterized protein (DUF111 family)